MDKLKIRNIKSDIIRILIDKAPDSIRTMRVYEVLAKDGYDTDSVDVAIESLLQDNKIKKTKGEATPQMSDSIKAIIEKREYIQLKDYSNIPINGEQRIGDNSVIKLLPYSRSSASELNEIIDTLVDYTNDLESKVTNRLRTETARIYRQMISIFGVFVSVFAIIVISTEKMLRFNPEILEKGWLELLWKSTALFLPVGIVIGLLVLIVMYGSRKK